MKGIQLQLAPCCDCSTIEGESELSTDQGTERPPRVYPYQGADNILLHYTFLLLYS